MKKFEKGCGVKTDGMSEVMFDTIKRVGEGNITNNYANFSNARRANYLTISILDNDYIFTNYSLGTVLTPTDILGEYLVKAIEDGFTPWFEGDELPDGTFDCVTTNGIRVNSISSIPRTWGIIAYKKTHLENVSEKPSNPVQFNLETVEGRTMCNDRFNKLMSGLSKVNTMSTEGNLTTNQQTVYKSLIKHINNQLGE